MNTIKTETSTGSSASAGTASRNRRRLNRHVNVPSLLLYESLHHRIFLTNFFKQNSLSTLSNHPSAAGLIPVALQEHPSSSSFGTGSATTDPTMADLFTYDKPCFYPKKMESACSPDHTLIRITSVTAGESRRPRNCQFRGSQILRFSEPELNVPFVLNLNDEALC
jgi:hypothetical protein